MVVYADGPEIEVELLIDAPTERVWEVVSDPSLPARFSEELLKAGWGNHPLGAPGLGSIIEGKNFNDASGEWSTKSIVTAWEPGRIFAWAVQDVDDSASRWRFELENHGGRTLLKQHYRIGPGPSGVLWRIEADPGNEEQIIEARLAFGSASMMRTLEAVKELVK